MTGFLSCGVWDSSVCSHHRRYPLFICMYIYIYIYFFLYLFIYLSLHVCIYIYINIQDLLVNLVRNEWAYIPILWMVAKSCTTLGGWNPKKKKTWNAYQIWMVENPLKTWQQKPPMTTTGWLKPPKEWDIYHPSTGWRCRLQVQGASLRQLRHAFDLEVGVGLGARPRLRAREALALGHLRRRMDWFCWDNLKRKP